MKEPAMVSFGYTLSSEEHTPGELVANAQRAEEAGFDFVSISDHYHPWVSAQGHSPFVWSVLGAIGQAAERVEIGVGVTCPTIRIHPAIIAQAAATTSLLCDGRFFLGVGSGEALNEHILGDKWPPAATRLEMLEEAVEIIRELWTGETLDHRGDHYEVENAKLFDPPDSPPPVVVSGFGPQAIELAGQIGDGYWGHSPEKSVVDGFVEAGGTGPKYSQLNLCWAPSEEDGRKTAYQVWPNAGVPGQLSQDLPTWVHFEEATQVVSEEEALKSIPCGPDPQPVVDSVRKFLDAGYDHLYFHQIGPDQEGFFRFWTDELGPAVRELASG
jgi:coenzyme F420-dependent glucose-6-phosphate dehydrogenase